MKDKPSPYAEENKLATDAGLPARKYIMAHYIKLCNKSCMGKSASIKTDPLHV